MIFPEDFRMNITGILFLNVILANVGKLILCVTSIIMLRPSSIKTLNQP